MHSDFLRITQVKPYALLMANNDIYACATLTFVLFIWNLHWESSQVIVATEKHQTIDYLDM